MDVQPAPEIPPAPPARAGGADMTLREAAAYAQRSVDTLRRAIRRGELPKRYTPSPHGAELIVSRAALERWLVQTGRAGAVQLAEYPLAALDAAQQHIDALEAQNQAQHQRIDALAAQVAALVAAQESAATQAQQRAGELAAQLAATQAQLDALAAQLPTAAADPAPLDALAARVQALEASRPPAPHAAGAVGEAPAGPSTRQPPGRPRRRSLLARLARALLS